MTEFEFLIITQRVAELEREARSRRSVFLAEHAAAPASDKRVVSERGTLRLTDRLARLLQHAGPRPAG